MKFFSSALCAVLLCVAPAWAALPFFDDFENGVGGNYTYAPWGNASGDPSSPNGINNLITTATNEHSWSGIKSARVFASDPAAWNGFADFGATPVPTGLTLRAEVYLFEDFNNNGTNGAEPVTNMLAIFGDSGGGPGDFTDYLQLGVVPFFPGGSQSYGYRTPTGGIVGTGVNRKAGWTKLRIEADAIADGGAVRFYIDDVLQGSSVRNGPDLRWVRLGNNSKSYESFWYDNLSVSLVPEPASATLLAFGGIAFAGCGLLRRRR